MSDIPAKDAAPQDRRHVIIVGGGVIGVCCAYYLAKRGARVTVLERDEIGKGASYGNAGVIAPGHAPINKPGRVRQALRSMMEPLSPLYIAPRPDPALVSWLWAFRAACTEQHVERALDTLCPLGHATASLFDELVDQEGLECDYRRDGYHEAYATAGALAAATKEAERLHGYGYHPEALSKQALLEREPALASHMVGGVFYPEAATVNPYKFVVGMAGRAQAHGVDLRAGTEVVQVETDRGTARSVRTAAGESISADAIVLAPGAYSPGLFRKLGLRLPMQPAKGYHRDCRPASGQGTPLRRACILGERMVFCTPMDDVLRLAGTLEFSGINHEIRRPRLEQLTKAADLYFGGVRDAEIVSEWCGLRPCLPDGVPAVGPIPSYQNLFVATGHAMMGLTLGPITGKLVADHVLDGAPGMDLGLFSPGRFA